ncbi:shikimate kinase [Jannaschia sp. Os4]|uniref:shikimate kinase n=1 Tax=Jannaschia sp. Os4 TaxID=2807617 RepID=UPI001939B6B6|nr:shikimate kinase [Jannaschia sp. Os4]MBM2577955.1 shikimate kinase [Jannaschia sp. Os4]
MGATGDSAPPRTHAALRRPVVLVGMMGSGKTAVGQALAERLQVPFRDSDHAIEDAARMSVAEIFARDGEAFFRDRESEVIARLLAEGPGVVSTGGGAFLSEATRETVAATAVSVWLRAAPEVLWPRVKGKAGRPLLARPDARAALEAMTRERAPVYGTAAVVVDSDGEVTVEGMVDRVIDALAGAEALA